LRQAFEQIPLLTQPGRYAMTVGKPSPATAWNRYNHIGNALSRILRYTAVGSINDLMSWVGAELGTIRIATSIHSRNARGKYFKLNEFRSTRP
jgi:hypothetical protein